MKYTTVKNILVVLTPTVLFFGYRFLQFRLEANTRVHVNPMWVMQYRLFLPVLIGALLFYISAYIYQNRNSLVFIWVFIGAFMLSASYAVYFFSMNPARAYSFVFRTSAPEIGFGTAGIYIAGFWVSLVSYIKSRKGLKQEAGAL